MENNIDACHPTIYPLPGAISETELPAGALTKTRRIDTSGLIKVGGALNQDRQRSVDAATPPDVITGTKMDAAVTPAALAPTLAAQSAAIAGKASIGRKPFAHANYTVAATDNYVALTSLSAPHTITLPAAAAFPPGQAL